MQKLSIISALIAASTSFAHSPVENYKQKPILADTALLKALDIPILQANSQTGVAYTLITPQQEIHISELAHHTGKCAGFEDLRVPVEQAAQVASQQLLQIELASKKQTSLAQFAFPTLGTNKDPKLENAVAQVQEANVKTWVEWLSSYPDRFNKGSNPNTHVDALKMRLQNWIVGADFPVEVSAIDHKSTRQKSLKLRIEGRTRPSEIIVIGAHLDSINSDFGGGKLAPGADDNASGSAAVLEALRVILDNGQPERTIEFFWYAGEESGLLGSAEIADAYKKSKQDVVAVLQLDMVLQPGDGPLVISSITDNTSAWLRDYLVELNRLYIGLRIVSDKCGYGCSDHASWFKNGYPTLLPFESTTKTMNRNIHTTRDIIDSSSNFTHAAAFSKIAVLFGLDLANSTKREPQL